MVTLPDPIRIARCRKSPELGPKILFFSGGSALKDVSRVLIEYTHHSIHIITPFDSGGSSALLREAFGMPAIGDVRNRLMSLADRSLMGNPQIFALFAHRFPKKANGADLRVELESMVSGRHPLVAGIPDPMRKIIRNHLHLFTAAMPGDFNLQTASIGNLILAAGYLNNQRHIDPVIFIFSKLVHVCGTVRPVVAKSRHLGVALENGDVILGQHRFTGKETQPLQSKIKRLFLNSGLDEVNPQPVFIRKKVAALIAEAELICYPMGSFYSSLIANFLPGGVGRSISKNPCPKVFIPNPVEDPELFETSLMDQIITLIDVLRRDDPARIGISDILNYVIVDTSRGRYPGELDHDRLSAWGIGVIDVPLITRDDGLIDAHRLVPILLSLV
ncbi:GAK system CofD-like protein [Desulfatiferula olefinivorans]